MPNLRGKTWTTTTPANVEDAQYWEDHLISDADAAKIGTVILPAGGTAGQVLTKQSSTANDATWEDPASSGHTIVDEDDTDMPYRTNLQFLNADVTDDSANDATVVDCKGSKGDPGQAATVTVGTTSTLNPGSSATVTNSGTTSAAVFNFGIPRGADGTNGTDGEDGVSVTGVTLYSTSGRVKTYRMTFSDGNHFDYEVTDGENGSGAGDMLQSDYDPNQTVYNAGGIPDYVASQAYTLPTAASNVLGGVKVGTNLSIDGSGVLSATDTNTDALHDLTDVNISLPSDGQALLYDSTNSKWVNGDVASGSGGSIITVTTTDSSLYGQTVTITDGTTTLTETLSNTGEATFEGVTLTGSLTVSTTGATPYALSAPYYGNYSVVLSAFSATITITYPSSLGATCTLTDGATTLTGTGSPMAFSIPNTGTWTATCTLDGVAKTESFVITTDGQTETHTFSYGTINLTFSNEFRGLNLTCTDGNTTITKTAPIAGNTMAFYPPNTGTWTISGVYSGVTYSSGSITVSSLSTPVSATIQTLASITVTIYGAKQDTITFTDAAGVSHTVSFASGATSKSETLKIQPTGSNITFTSSVSKNPSNLSQDYSKNVSLTQSTSSVYVMPDNALYWWGYNNGIEKANSANGWTEATSYPYKDTTVFNTNNISMTSTNGTYDATYIGSHNKQSGTMKLIVQGVTGFGGGAYGQYGVSSTKTIDCTENITDNTMKLYSIAASNEYFTLWVYSGRASNIYAVWAE